MDLCVEDAIETVTHNGLLLKYFNATLQDIDSVVRAAIASNPNAIKYASLRLLADSTLVGAASAQNGMILNHVTSPGILADASIVRAACNSSDGHALQFAHSSLRADVAFVRSLLGVSCAYAFSIQPAFGALATEAAARGCLIPYRQV
jgi:hypothetical protein